MAKKNLPPYLLNITILLIALLASVAIGSVFIPPGTFIKIVANQLPMVDIDPTWPDSFNTIIFKVRLPHTILIMHSRGQHYQEVARPIKGIFRNPLADPYLIGVASGAGLGSCVGNGA